MAVFRPVFRPGPERTIRGHAFAVVDMEAFFRLGHAGDEVWNGWLGMDIYRLEAGRLPRRLVAWPAERAGGEGTGRAAFEGCLVRPIFGFGGKAHAVAVRTADALAFRIEMPGIDWATLAAGMALTAIAAFAIGLVAHRREDMERMVERRSAELVESLRRYQELAQVNRTLTWKVDADGLYVSISGPVEEMLGYRPQELVGRVHLYDLHPEEGREAFRTATMRIFGGKEPFRDMVNPMVAKTGETIWTSTYGIPILGPGGELRGYQGTDTDVSARKAVEDELRLQSELQRLLVEISTTFINLPVSEVDQAITVSLERLGRLFGADRAYLFEYDFGRQSCTNTHEWCAEGIEPQIASLKELPLKAVEFAARRHRQGEMIHVPDASQLNPGWGRDLLEPKGVQSLLTVPLMSTGECQGFVGFDSIRRKHRYTESEQRLLAVFAQMVVGIRGRKKTVDELARLARINTEAAGRYKALIRASNTGAWEYDDATGHMWASPEYFAMLGRDPSRFEVSGGEPNIEAIWLNWLHPDDVERARGAFIEYIKRPGVLYEQTFRMRHEDGHWMWILSRGQVLRDAEGQPMPVVLGTHIDVTRAKIAEQFREMGVRTLQILNQVGDLGDLLGELAKMLREQTGFDSVGIRLEQGGGYPYAARAGTACPFGGNGKDPFRRDAEGRIERDARGRLTMRCDCGLLLAGNADDPAAPPPPGDACWTNDAELLFSLQGLAATRSGSGCGARSFALVPVWVRDRIVGFLQFADSRKGQFTGEVVQILVGLAAHLGEALLRKRAEQDYRTLFHEMLEGFAVHEMICDAGGKPVDYRFLAVNPSFERLTGLKAEEIVGRTVRQALSTVEPELIERYGEVAATGEPCTFEHHAGGLGRTYEVTAFRPSPGQFACIFTDVTDRRRGEIERERLTRAIEQSGETVVITDEKGTILYVNPAFEKTTGFSREEALGQNPRVLKSGQHDAEFYRRMWGVLEAGEVWEGEIVNRRKDGSLFIEFATISPVRDTEGRVAYYVAVKRDVTAQKRAETALAESEQNYRTLADSGQVLIWTSGLDRRRNYFNAPWLRFTGKTRRELEGDGWKSLLHAADREAGLRAIEGACDRCESYQIEYRLQHADGEYRWVREEGSPRFNREGAFLGYIGHGVDISDRKAAETERVELQDQLLQSQKMESVGRLAGGIAHDFNNMLQAILGYVEMALDQIPEEAPVRSDVLEIQKTARRSAELTRQLQTFARKQAITPKVLNFNEAVAGMTGMLRRLIGESVSLNWRPGRTAGAVKMDPAQVDQIVANLCINAADAIRETGTVALRTRGIRLTESKRTKLGAIDAGEYVLFSVRDDGCGMSEEVLGHLFEPFFTTKRKGKGTGLGLATVYGIVKQNRGGIRVRSRVGRGSLFQILLPKTHEAGVAEAAGAEGEASRGTETVLVVDDEQNILQATRRMLESLGYRVLAASSAREAIELFEAKREEIDLLLTDVVMPEMSGPELRKRLGEAQPRMKHLFMSGYTANLIAEKGVSGSGANYLAKPFSRSALARKVRQALDA